MQHCRYYCTDGNGKSLQTDYLGFKDSHIGIIQFRRPPAVSAKRCSDTERCRICNYMQESHKPNYLVLPLKNFRGAKRRNYFLTSLGLLQIQKDSRGIRSMQQHYIMLLIAVYQRRCGRNLWAKLCSAIKSLSANHAYLKTLYGIRMYQCCVVL